MLNLLDIVFLISAEKRSNNKDVKFLGDHGIEQNISPFFLGCDELNYVALR